MEAYLIDPRMLPIWGARCRLCLHRYPTVPAGLFLELFYDHVRAMHGIDARREIEEALADWR